MGETREEPGRREGHGRKAMVMIIPFFGLTTSSRNGAFPSLKILISYGFSLFQSEERNTIILKVASSNY